MEDKKLLNKFLKITPFICAMMVVGIHSYNAGEINQLSLTARIEGSLSHGLFTAAVPIFFFLSGYLFFRNAESIKDVIKKQKRRVKSIGIPFLMWSTFYYLFYAITTRLVPGLMNTRVDVSLTGILKGIFFYEYVFPMWFMFQLILYTILTPIIFAILKNKKLSIILCIFMVILGVTERDFVVSIASKDRAIFQANYFSYYFIGCLAARNKKIFLNIINFLSKLHTCLIGGLLIVFSILEGYAFDVWSIFNKRIFIPIIAVLTFILLLKISRKMQNEELFISKIPTMIVYGLHPLIGLIVGKTLGILNLHSLVCYVIGFIFSAVITCFLALLLRKNKLLNLLFNGDR